MGVPGLASRAAAVAFAMIPAAVRAQEAAEFGGGAGGFFEQYRLLIVGGAGFALVALLVVLALKGGGGVSAQAEAEQVADARKRSVARRLAAVRQNLSRLQTLLVNAGERGRVQEIRELAERLARLQEYVDKADRVDGPVDDPLSYLIESSDTAVSLAEGNLPRVDKELARMRGWIAEVSNIVVTKVIE